MASSYWGYSLFSTPKDEDPMGGIAVMLGDGEILALVCGLEEGGSE